MRYYRKKLMKEVSKCHLVIVWTVIEALVTGHGKGWLDQAQWELGPFSEIYSDFIP